MLLAVSEKGAVQLVPTQNSMGFIFLPDLPRDKLRTKRCQVLLMTVIHKQGVARCVVFEVCWTCSNKRTLKRRQEEGEANIQQAKGFPVCVFTCVCVLTLA